jgi:two-component system OmpR family response regulator
MCNNPVLLIDGDLISRLLSCAILRDSGFDVIEARTAMDALPILERHPRLSALVADVGPGSCGNGFEIARLARLADPELPVVYISGTNLQQYAREGVREAMFIPRPFDPDQVVKALDQATRLAPAETGFPRLSPP